MRRPFQFKPQETKDVLWSFSKIGLRHPSLFRAVAKHLVGDNSHSILKASAIWHGLTLDMVNW